MKLKPIQVTPERKYAAEFFDEVAKRPEGAFFEYEEATNYQTLRGIARAFEKSLGRKFAIRTIEEGAGEAKTTKFAVGVTTRIIVPKKRKPNSTVTAPPSFEPIHTPAMTEE